MEFNSGFKGLKHRRHLKKSSHAPKTLVSFRQRTPYLEFAVSVGMYITSNTSLTSTLLNIYLCVGILHKRRERERGGGGELHENSWYGIAEM